MTNHISQKKYVEVFVYDSLKVGRDHCWIMKRADGLKIKDYRLDKYFIVVGNTNDLYETFIVEGPLTTAFVNGEIWSINEQHLHMLDFFKGVKLGLSERVLLTQDNDKSFYTWISAKNRPVNIS